MRDLSHHPPTPISIKKRWRYQGLEIQASFSHHLQMHLFPLILISIFFSLLHLPFCTPLHFYSPASIFMIFYFSLTVLSVFLPNSWKNNNAQDSCSTNCARNYSECFNMHHLIYPSQQPDEVGTIIFPLCYIWAKWGSSIRERLGNLLKRTQRISNRAIFY